MDTIKIIRGRWVIPNAEKDAAALLDSAVVIEGDSIRELGDWQEVRKRYPRAQVIGSDNSAVIPGLINAHHHSHGVSSVQHGISDMLLEPWILSFDRMRQTDPYLDVLLSSASQLRTGVTTVVDVYSDAGDAQSYANKLGRALEAYDKSGMRVAFAAGLRTQSFLISGEGEDQKFIESLPEDLQAYAKIKLPGPDRISEDEYFAVLEDAWRRYRTHPRIDVWLGPPGPQWVSDAFMQRIAERAEEWDTGAQTHVDESIYEMLHGTKFYGRHTMLHLDELGVLSPRFSIAHGVWLTESEIEIMARTGAGVSHNPSSNLRLRAGIAPLNALLAAGVTTGLGMDGTSLNDDEDSFTEMRLAMRLHRTPTLSSPAPEPYEVFGMATSGGAKLLRREARLGRLAAGFAADIVLLDLDRITWPWTAPEVDPRELVLMRAKAADVRTVLIDGEVVLQDGKPTRFDADDVARTLAEKLSAEPYPEERAQMVRRLLPHLEAWYRGWELPSLDPWITYNSRK